MKKELAELLYRRGQREGIKRLHNYEGGIYVCLCVCALNMCVGEAKYVCGPLYMSMWFCESVCVE